MRKIIWSSLFAAALVTTGACKKRNDDLDRSAKAVEKATDNANEQVKDVAKESKDLAKDNAEMAKDLDKNQDKMAKDVMKDQDKIAKDQADMAQQQAELNSATADLARARDNYAITAKQHLASIDAKIHELDVRADQKSHDLANRLRARRDELNAKLDTINSNSTKDSWNDFKKDVDDSFDKLEKDVDDATKR